MLSQISDISYSKIDEDEFVKNLENFVYNLPKRSKLAVVTGGGTIVPLEKNTVRTISNLSTGRRGSLCTEHLLKNGYTVILLTNRNSLKPFVRMLNDVFSLCLNEIHYNFERTRSLVEKFKNKVLILEYTYLDEYLIKFELISSVLFTTEHQPLYIVSAAVSDYYVPCDKLATHKIKDNDFSRVITSINRTPKLLGPIYKKYCLNSLFITLKLETKFDELFENCQKLLSEVGNQVTVGNISETYRDELWIYKGVGDVIHLTRYPDDDIESLLVDELIKLHNLYLNYE